MNVDRLLRFAGAAKARATAAWVMTTAYLAGARRWVTRRWRLIEVIIAGSLLLCLGWLYGQRVWSAYAAKPELYTPFFTPIGALLVGLAAFGQWRTARLRHEEQTNADRRRRITETYSKAVTQLASDKLEERLGGIYTLESISKESPDDYWTVMETMTAFVRERSQHNYAGFKKSDERISPLARTIWERRDKPEGKDNEIWEEAIRQGEPPAADIDAVLTVIKRRSEQSRERERTNDWHLDLSQAVLKQANLRDAQLEGAVLVDAHLEGALLWNARLEGAILMLAHLEGADLVRAHVEGADLTGADGLSATQLTDAHGDAETRLPAGVERPSHWPEPAADGESEGAT